MRFALAPIIVSIAAFAQQAGPPAKAPLRNTFVVATESVLDQAASLDLNAEAAAFDPGMATLRMAAANLAGLAADDREQSVIDKLKDMTFTLSACRIQAVDGADISKCLLQLGDERARVLQTIHKHKENGAWADGDPKP